jgi:S1-C subfamily serine protease
MNTTLASFSDELANLAATGALSVVQVAGGRRPASGVVHGPDTIITTARVIGREDGLRVRLPDDSVADADLAGWDPSSGIAVLRARAAVNLAAPAAAETEPRTGSIVLALARSWSNAATASTGIVAVVGGPLRTGRRRQIARVIRVTAPMHDGFAGGAVFDTTGHLVGLATAGEIRGLGVVIPAAIAWASATQVLTSGTPRRGFLGVAVQGVTLAVSQRPDGREHALLVVGVTPSSPAEIAGINVGDILLEVAGKPTESPDDLLDLLSNRSAGQTVAARTLRGGSVREVQLTIAERPQAR